MKILAEKFRSKIVTRKLSLGATCLLGALLSPLICHGLGFRIPNQDAEATARGNAFVATADNPSAIYYNPAGIRQIDGTEAQFGLHIISVSSHFEGEGTGVTADSDFAIQAVPQFYAVFTPKDSRFSFGLGTYAPYGLGLEWPEDVPFRNQGLEGRLLYATVTPVVAWQLLPSLSIAAGPTVNYAQLLLRRGIGVLPGDEFRFKGDGWAFGGKAGLRWQPAEKWAFGLSYVSPTRVDFGGNSTAYPFVPGANSTSVKVPFPQFAMAGVSFRPNSKWNIEIGADWTDWDSLKTVTLKGTAFGDAPFPLNWESSFMANVGVSRYFENGYWIAAGYFYSPNSTSEHDFTPIVPDTDLHVGSLGFGHRGEHWSWAVSGQIIAGPPRTINNGTPADGTYQFFNQAVNVSLSYRF
jgi:long-chain fatty acid transport protein